MAVTIKSAREIELMREAGKILGNCHNEMADKIKAGMSAYEIDQIAEKLIRGYGCEPSFLGYNGFPGSVCISINDEVVHGLPEKDKFIKDGDIVSLDMGVIYHGYQSDAARTIAIGQIDPEVQKLIDKFEIDEIVFEDIQLQTNVGNNVKTFKILAEVFGIIYELATELKIKNTAVLSGVWKSALGIKGKRRPDQKHNAQLYVNNTYHVNPTQDECDAICIGAYATKYKFLNEDSGFDWSD